MSRDRRRVLADELRALHQGTEPLVLPNVWDVASAVVVARLPGCRAIATSSAAVANGLGYPDGERIPAAEMLDAVARIARAVELPVTADLEAGYGDPAATAEAAIAAGAVGLNLEDGNRPVEEHVERIRAVRDAGERLGVPLVINGRTDVFLSGSRDVDDAVERANAYLRAGADCAFVIGVTEAATIGRLAAAIDGPLNVLVTGDSPSVSELARLGVRRISVGSALHRVALAAAEDAARALLGDGAVERLASPLSFADLHALLG